MKTLISFTLVVLTHLSFASTDLKTCQTGTSQSPIDLISTEHKRNFRVDNALLPLDIKWKPSHLNLLEKGHHIEVAYDQGSKVNFQGQPFELKQFHFHTPSEHTVNGKHYPLEVHFVHKNENGDLLVIGLLVEEGSWNKDLGVITEEKEHHTDIFATTLLPRELTYFNYKGSLTTPPCTEGVTWVVLEHSIQASKEQIAFIKNKNHGENSRDIQPLNYRSILKCERY